MSKDTLMNILFVIAIALAVFITSFGLASMWKRNHGNQSGYIYQKHYEPPRDYTTAQTISNGKTTTTIYVPQHAQEKFTLYFREGDRTNWAYVPQSMWESAQVGQYFDGDCYCVKAQ